MVDYVPDFLELLLGFASEIHGGVIGRDRVNEPEKMGMLAGAVSSRSTAEPVHGVLFRMMNGYRPTVIRNQTARSLSSASVTVAS